MAPLCFGPLLQQVADNKTQTCLIKIIIYDNNIDLLSSIIKVAMPSCVSALRENKDEV